MEFMDFLTAVSSGLSIFLFKKVMDMPKEYLLKVDFKDFENKIDTKLDKINDKLDNLMKG